MIGKEKILDILDSVIKKSEADQTEAVYIGGESGLTRFANSTIHQNVFEVNSKVYFRAALGKKIGVAGTNSFAKTDLEKALSNATEIAKNQKENPDFPGLPFKAEVLGLNTYFEKTAHFTPILRAQEIKKIFDQAKVHNLTAAGSFSTGESEIAVVNTNEVVCYQPLTSTFINIVMTGDNSSGYADYLSRDVSDVKVEHLAGIAIQKCLDSKDPKDLEPGEYDVLLEPTAVAALLEWMNYIGFGSKSFQEGTSFLSNRIGQKIMGENITIYDDGSDESAIAFPFDFEGVPKQRVTLVEGGVAKGVVYDSISAHKDKVRSTGHALTPDNAEGALALNLFIEAGDSSMDRMIESENGKVKNGVKNLRFTESMLKAFSNVAQISADRKIVNSWWGDVGCVVAPAMLIKNFKFTGKTEF